jgi:hypothetical protein
VRQELVDAVVALEGGLPAGPGLDQQHGDHVVEVEVRLLVVVHRPAEIRRRHGAERPGRLPAQADERPRTRDLGASLGRGEDRRALWTGQILGRRRDDAQRILRGVGGILGGAPAGQHERPEGRGQDGHVGNTMHELLHGE